jgi:Rv0078B-related antitoxin
MDPKPRPNRRLYLQVLRRMTPEQRLNKAFELTEMARALFRQGLRRRFPDASEEELHRLYLEGLARCHNRNY